MGDMADYLRDSEEYFTSARDFSSEEEFELEDLLQRSIWRTASGKEIPINQMTDNHLNNTINYLKRGKTYYKPSSWVIKLTSEQLRRKFI